VKDRYQFLSASFEQLFLPLMLRLLTTVTVRGAHQPPLSLRFLVGDVLLLVSRSAQRNSRRPYADRKLSTKTETSSGQGAGLVTR